MAVHGEEDFKLPSCIRGHHVYKDVWTPIIGEVLQCVREVGNVVDRYAVGVIKNDNTTVGHLPKRMSMVCSAFIRRGGRISCEVTGVRKRTQDLRQGGLEVPCTLTFNSKNDKDLQNLKKLLKA